MAIPAFSTSSGDGSRTGLNSRSRWALARLAAYHKAKKIRIEAVRRATTVARVTERFAEPRRFRATTGAVAASPVEAAGTTAIPGRFASALLPHSGGNGCRFTHGAFP